MSSKELKNKVYALLRQTFAAVIRPTSLCIVQKPDFGYALVFMVAGEKVKSATELDYLNKLFLEQLKNPASPWHQRNLEESKEQKV